MGMFARFCVGLGLALGIVSGASARAALIALDDPIFGPTSFTRDTETSLDWLDLTQATDRSYTDVSGQFGVGGDFAGLRHATIEEVQTLFLHAGLEFELPGEFVQAPVPAVNDLAALVGATSFRDGNPNLTGLTGSPTTSGTGHRVVSAGYTFLSGIPHYQIGAIFGYGDQVASPSIGHWLIRPVPEPGTAPLIGLGLGCLARWRRRRVGQKADASQIA